MDQSLDRFMLLLVAILLLGFATRLYAIGAENLWLDEASSLLAVQHDLAGVVQEGAADVHPPVYYLLLHFWLVFGTSETALRLLSAMVGTLAIPLLYIVSRRLLDVRTSLTAALLLAMAPLHIWYSQEARSYALMATVGLLSMYTWLNVLGGKERHQGVRTRHWTTYVLINALGLYTHYYFGFLLIFQNAAMILLLVFAWQGRQLPMARRWQERPESLLYRWVLSQAAILLLFVPWLPILVAQIRRGEGAWIIAAEGVPSWRALLVLLVSFAFWDAPELLGPWARRTGYVLFGLGIGLALWQAMRDRTLRSGVVLALGWLLFSPLLVWTISQVRPIFSIRYLLLFLPAFPLLVAAGIAGVRDWRLRNALLAGLVGLLTVAVVQQARLPQRADWRGVADYIAAYAEPGDWVLFIPTFNVKPFEYYNRGRVAVNEDMEADIFDPAWLQWAATSHQRVWLVWQPEHYFDRQGVVRDYLAAHGQLVDQQRFRGVGLVLLYRITK